MTDVVLDLQTVYTPSTTLPSVEDFKRWVNTTFAHTDFGKPHAEVTIRVVNNADIRTLNRDYRSKDKVTNVLSFPYHTDDLPVELAIANEFIGDIIIAPDVLEMEAREQHKKLSQHWAHMTVHGLLHLLGYDHENAQEAQEMEKLEVNILSALSIPNPYEY